MTPIEISRLHDIAAQTMKTWIERQILETAQPLGNAVCEDQVECVVNQAINWRRDYIAALTAARNFNTLADYDSALNHLQADIRRKEADRDKAFKGLNSVRSSEDFNDVANAILSPMALSNREIFLQKVRRVFVYLHGKMENPEDFKHIGTPEGYSRNLLTIMKEQGTLDEWKDLINRLPGPTKATYTQHIAGWAVPKP